jgi:hypothetical protein
MISRSSALAVASRLAIAGTETHADSRTFGWTVVETVRGARVTGAVLLLVGLIPVDVAVHVWRANAS